MRIWIRLDPEYEYNYIIYTSKKEAVLNNHSWPMVCHEHMKRLLRGTGKKLPWRNEILTLDITAK
jgi:hypothetical protein